MKRPKGRFFIGRSNASSLAIAKDNKKQRSGFICFDSPQSGITPGNPFLSSYIVQAIAGKRFLFSVLLHHLTIRMGIPCRAGYSRCIAAGADTINFKMGMKKPWKPQG
jgi:hypothetical protein